MKATIRHLTAVVALMFLSLMVSTSIIQVFAAPALNADPHNFRTIVRDNIANRGAIMVGKEAIAYSKPVKDQYRYLRVYPQGPLYAAITGYQAPTLNSSTGLESAEAATLSGTSDSFLWQRLRTLLDGKESPSGSIALTINPKVQAAAYKGFGNQRGAAVAIDPRTGAILAMVSLPSFDPNKLSSHNAAAVDKAVKEFKAAKYDPLLNRAIHQTYTPGSVFKVVTATAMLQAGIKPDTVLDSPTAYKSPGTDVYIRNYGGLPCGHNGGKEPLVVSFLLSCNTPFAIEGYKYGFNKLNEVAKTYGLDRPLNIPMHVITSTLSSEPNKIDAAGAALTAFGQKDVQMSPLQGAMIAAAVANHGVLMRPYLVSTELSSNLEVISHTDPQVLSTPLTREQADEMRQMMVQVVKRGTGMHAQIPGVEVAAKSGTAELAGNLAPHGWFLAFAPAQNPVIAVAVIVENGGDIGHNGTGGVLAGPIARDMIKAALNK